MVNAVDAEAYKRHKLAAAERQRRIAEAGKEIGELPAVVDPARKERCRYNLREFLDSYLTALYPLKWSRFHLAAIQTLQELILHGGLFANAMPRGSGKSSLIIGAIIWAGVYGHQSYAAIVCATDPKAVTFVDDIKTQLEVNPHLAEDFPEVCFPILCLERVTQRARGQTYKGVHTVIEWMESTIVFPTIQGYKSSGFRVATAGITGDIRGLRYTRRDGTMCRPDFIVIDDPQTDESAKSVLQTKDRIDVTQGAILGLFGPGERPSAAMAVTVIRKGDYADHYLVNPDWQGQKCGLIEKLPTGEQMDLWCRYREIQKESIAQRAGKDPEKEFYRANREAMDAGLIANWEARYNTQDELSAIQAAMNLYFLFGAKKFKAEYMNDPEALTEGDVYRLSPNDVSHRLSSIPRGTVPDGYDFLTCGIDIQMRVIWWVVMAWKMDMTGTVVDYGWYPQQRNRSFNLEELSATLQSASGATEADVDAAVSWGLTELGGDVLARDWLDEAGNAVPLVKAQVDINWKESELAVARFCKLKAYREKILPSRGLAMLKNRRRISEWKVADGERAPKPEERRQCEWIVTSRKHHGLAEVYFDPNHWKSHINWALSMPLQSAGSLSLYGESPLEHEMLSDHLTSHYPVQVAYNGASQQQWLLRAGVTRDDLLDCMTNACVAASRHGARLTREKTTLPVVKPEPKKRVTKKAEEL